MYLDIMSRWLKFKINPEINYVSTKESVYVKHLYLLTYIVISLSALNNFLLFIINYNLSDEVTFRYIIYRIGNHFLSAEEYLPSFFFAFFFTFFKF